MTKKNENPRLTQLNTLADYVEEVINQEMAEGGLIDKEEPGCIDCLERAFDNDFLRSLFSLRIELRERIAEEELLLKGGGGS
jgi:hypothetical protein